MNTDRIIAVVGATATGKSTLALDLADALGGEIVNADAMQLYRGMDIGTAKVAVGERRGIRHHQLDVLDVTQEASVAAYQRHARADLDAIADRGRVPILVGGSGLYVRAALDALDIPPTDPRVRARWETYAEQHGPDAAHRALADRDPVAGREILPANTRRVVRALEVIELTGAPFGARLPARTHRRPTLTLGLTMARETLDERIGIRTEGMWAEGMVEEVRRLDAAGLRLGRTAALAIGYPQALAELDGRLTRAAAIAETAQATRRFVRRQESWLRPDPRIVWLDALAPDLLDRALSAVRSTGARPGE